ncbi:MAG: DUF4852 domain-containing protein [Pseudomonadota bacterium]|nr:DUF4852 domain-containing protein [Pseudomonadota bacterium]
MLKRFGLLFLCLFLTFPAQADPLPAHADAVKPDDYIRPTWSDLLRTMVRFNALDLSDDNLLDSYASVTECDLYQFYYKDDFKWNQVRKSLRESISMNTQTFPVYYRFDSEVLLDRYDFQNKVYRFQEKSVIRNVNLFRIYDVQGSPCGDPASQYMPRSFQAASDTTVNLNGLPLAPADAQALLRQMNDDKNYDRVLFMRVNMTVTYIGRLHKEITDLGVNGKRAIYFQNKDTDPHVVKLDVRLDSVAFYEDQDKTKLVYTFKPEL